MKTSGLVANELDRGGLIILQSKGIGILMSLDMERCGNIQSEGDIEVAP